MFMLVLLVPQVPWGNTEASPGGPQLNSKVRRPCPSIGPPAKLPPMPSTGTHYLYSLKTPLVEGRRHQGREGSQCLHRESPAVSSPGCLISNTLEQTCQHLLLGRCAENPHHRASLPADFPIPAWFILKTLLFPASSALCTVSCHAHLA